MPALAARIVTRAQDLDDWDQPTFADREIPVWDNTSGKYMGGVATLSAAGALTAQGATLSGITAGSVLFAGTAGLVSQDNSNFVWDDANNRLAVGTASPAGHLHVKSLALANIPIIVEAAASQSGNLSEWRNSSGTALTAITADARMNVMDGFAATPSYSWLNDPDTGFYRLGDNRIGITLGGTLQWEIDAQGRLGLGTVPAWDLHIARNLNEARGLRVLNSNAGSSSEVFFAFHSDTAIGAFEVFSSTFSNATLRNRAVFTTQSGTSGLMFATLDAAADLQFHTGGNIGSFASRLTIGSGGAIVYNGTAALGHITQYVSAAATIGHVIQAAASQSANLQEWQSSAGAVYGTMTENGYWTTRKVAAPADGELSNSEVAFWLDDTPGTTLMRFKAKDSAGTVRTGSVALT